jgi:hypothetical protein
MIEGANESCRRASLEGIGGNKLQRPVYFETKDGCIQDLNSTRVVIVYKPVASVHVIGRHPVLMLLGNDIGHHGMAL